MTTSRETACSFAEVSAALPASSALVAFVRYQGRAIADRAPSYLAFVSSGSEPSARGRATWRRGEHRSLVVQWRKQLDQEAIAAGRGGSRSEAAYRRVAGELRRHIWDPLLPHVSNARRVFIVPDGALHLVSFAGLPAGTTGYLVETGPVIHYLAAERDLVSAAPGPAAGRGLLALGVQRSTRPARLRPRPVCLSAGRGRPAAIFSQCSLGCCRRR